MAFRTVYDSSNPLLGAPSLDQMVRRATSHGPAPSAPSQGGALSSDISSYDHLTCRTRRRPSFYVY